MSKTPLPVYCMMNVEGELDAALAFHLSILPHARRLPLSKPAAAKLQTAWAKIVRTRTRPNLPREQVFPFRPVFRFNSGFAHQRRAAPHVVISYLPSVARKNTLAVLGAVPRRNSGRAYADIVHRQNSGFPSREGGFDSHYPLQGQRPPECV